MELLAIVKANAYGHGLKICAPAFVRAGAQWLGVTSVEEGAEARGLCPRARILVIGSAFPGQGGAVVEHKLTPVMWEQWQLDELESACRAAGTAPNSLAVHLELDTGMSRQGAALSNPDDQSNLDNDALVAMLSRFTPASPLRLEGIMTHLFAADQADGAVTSEQLKRLRAALARIDERGHCAEYLNVGNSAALLGGQAVTIAELAARHGMKALLRPGLALYGIVPRFEPAPESDEPTSMSTARQRLQPVLEWKSRVASVRSVPARTVVGYNGTFVATEPMRLALVPLGYADGLDRRLGNRFSLLVHGQRAPVVGRISMDQTVLGRDRHSRRRPRRRSSHPWHARRRNHHRLRPRRRLWHHPMGGLHADLRARAPRSNLSRTLVQQASRKPPPIYSLLGPHRRMNCDCVSGDRCLVRFSPPVFAVSFQHRFGFAAGRGAAPRTPGFRFPQASRQPAARTSKALQRRATSL